MKPHTDKVPEAMRKIFDSITSKTEPFAKQYLNEEYASLIRTVTATLCRKRPSPLQKVVMTLGLRELFMP
jgi:hypothetical protein